MDNELWLKNIIRFRLLSWLIALGLMIAGIKIASLVNLLVYAPNDIDPEITLWFNFIIVFTGYGWWSAHIASNVIAKVIQSLFKAVFKTLFRKRRLKKEEVEEIGNEVFNEEQQMKLISDIRKGTRAFSRSGIILGGLMGLLHILFINPSPGIKGFAIYLFYGYAWGYLWYRLAWFGIVPLPPEEID